MTVPGRERTDRTPEFPSSFPVSSPSFWAEAATLSIPSPSLKHSRPSSPDQASTEYHSLRNDEPSPPPSHKRSRHYSQSPDHGLSFLPAQGDVTSDDPHAYLANPEYAPNKFGDIGDYMRKKEIKVQAQNANIAAAYASGSSPQIFAGLSFYINGNTRPPMEHLRKLILQRGGTVYPVLRNKTMVDYIIAPMLTMKKHEEFKRYKVVKEAWLVESCEQEKLLDWRRWRLRPEGGWEADSRRGFESFLGQVEKPAQAESRLVQDVVSSAQEPNIPAHKTPDPPAKVELAKHLLTPQRHRLPTIPISPGQPSSSKPSSLPRSIQKPEGAWEHYYTKESNANAAKALESETWRARNTAERGNADGFIDGYYQNSRLHHLSMWKAELKVLVHDAQKRSEEALARAADARAGKDGTRGHHSLADSVLPSIPLPAAPSLSTERVILHVDFDAFFVSCGLASRPNLKGKPIVVCHSSGKGVGSTSEIASCSYEARAKGVRNGMSLGRARELVGADIVTMHYEFDTYKKYSLAFYTVLMSYADELQAVSVDEALVDVTSQVAARAALPEESGRKDTSRPYRDPAIELAERIRDDVRKVTDGCEVSIGISHNILLAKLSTRHAKPAGVHHLLPESIPSFLAPLDVEDFPSVGYSTKAKIMAAFNTTIAGELLDTSKSRWRGVLGEKTGEMLWGYLRGIDTRRLEGDKVRKSVSAEMNYGIRFKTQEQAERYVRDLAAEVAKRMRNVRVKGRMITLKLMKRHPDAPIEPPKFLGHGWCATYNRSTPLSAPRGGATDDPAILAEEAVKLLRALEIDPIELRGVGIQITKLDNVDLQNNDEPREAGQATLSFTKKPLYEAGVSVPGLQAKDPTEDLDGLDPEFLAALPPSLAREVLRDHSLMKRGSSEPLRGRVEPDTTVVSSPAPNTEVIPILSSSPLPEAVSPSPLRPPIHTRQRTSSPTKQPRKTESGKNSAAHITKQLMPKGKFQMRAGQLAEGPLFGAWARAHGPRERSVGSDCVVDFAEITSPRDKGKGKARLSPEKDVAKVVQEEEIVPGYTLSALQALNIDPSVLMALPARMQKEVIQQEEENAERRRALFQPGRRLRSRGGSASVSPTKPGASRVKAVLPSTKIFIPPKPALMNATSISDVLTTVESWIESRKDHPPAEKDVGKVVSYLKKCLNEPVGQVGDGVERAVEVLQWMRVILKEKWGGTENDDDQVGGDAGDVRTAWWKVWRQMRDEVVEISVNKFGAGLKI